MTRKICDLNDTDYRCIEIPVRVIEVSTKNGSERFVATCPNPAFIARLRKIDKSLIHNIMYQDIQITTVATFGFEEEAKRFLSGKKPLLEDFEGDEDCENPALSSRSGKAVRELSSGKAFRSLAKACAYFRLPLRALQAALKVNGRIRDLKFEKI